MQQEVAVKTDIVLLEKKPVHVIRGTEAVVRFYDGDPYCYKELKSGENTWMLYGIEDLSDRDSLEQRAQLLQLIFDTITEELGESFECPTFYVQDEIDGPVVIARQRIVEGVGVLDFDNTIFSLVDPVDLMKDPKVSQLRIRSMCAEKYVYAENFQYQVITAFFKAITRLEKLRQEEVDVLLARWKNTKDRFPDVHFGNYRMVNAAEVIYGVEEPEFVIFDL